MEREEYETVDMILREILRHCSSKNASQTSAVRDWLTLSCPEI